MNAFQNPLIRIIASIAVGLLLILYPNAALPTILLIIGILIGLPSLYALLIYLLSEDRNKLPFPVLSLVMLLFGCTLMLFPGWYIGITVYVLGGALVLIGVYQILYLLTLKKKSEEQSGLALLSVTGYRFAHRHRNFGQSVLGDREGYGDYFRSGNTSLRYH